MPVLDTNFLIAVQEREASALRLLAEIQREPLLVPSIVAVEFLTPYGAAAREAYEELDRAFTLAHTTPEWIQGAAKLRGRLRKEGRSIRLADFWIAAWASRHDTIVITRNGKDFEGMGIKTRAW